MAVSISVLMPVLNGDFTHLALSIESILSQSFKDFEFIIVDDGSDTKTKAFLQKYAQKDDRVNIITNQENIGVGRSLNLGIEAAKGRYIARHDADDITHSTRLAKQLAFLDKNQNLAMCCTAVNHIDMQGERVGGFPMSENSDLIRAELLLNSRLCHPSLMIRTSVLKDVEGYPLTKRAQDYLLYLKLLKHGYKLGGLSEVLVDYRINTQSITRKNRGKQLSTAEDGSYEHVSSLYGHFNRQAFANFWHYVAFEGDYNVNVLEVWKLKGLLAQIKQDPYLYQAWAGVFRWSARQGLSIRFSVSRLLLALYFRYLY